MWDELNRWWLGNRKPRPQPPEQRAVESPPDSENEPQPPRAQDVTEFENSLAAAQPPDTPQTMKAEDSIQEPECVKASPDHSDSTWATQDDCDADLSSESRPDSGPSDPLDGERGLWWRAADEPILDPDEPSEQLGESFPPDWQDPEALLPGPFGGRPTRPRGRRLARPELEKLAALMPQQRLAILDY